MQQHSCTPRRNTVSAPLYDGENPSMEVQTQLRRILLAPGITRTKADFEFLDRYVHSVTYFADLPPTERLKHLKAVKGLELDKGDELFRIGDTADAFYCIMYGTVNVVMDFTRMAAPTLAEFEEIINRAKVHSSFLNPGGTLDTSQDATYIVRCMKPLECFGDVGLLTTEQQRTASVVANETTLLMKIDKHIFMDLRNNELGREMREKISFLTSVWGFDHWDVDSVLYLAGRMEKMTLSYNDVVITEGEPANYFYFIKHGECRLIKRYMNVHPHDKQPCFVEICAVSRRHYFGSYEIILGEINACSSALVSSPSAILYRIDRADFRHLVMKDPVTEQLMRTEALELCARISETKVREDLQMDRKWRHYKRELVNSIFTKHARDHASARMGQRTPLRPPRRYQIAHDGDSEKLPKLKIASSTSTTAAVLSPRYAVGRPDTNESWSMHTLNQHQQRRRSSLLIMEHNRSQHPGQSKQWLEWAKQRAKEIVDTHDDQYLDSDKQQYSKSNIHWSKTSKIMGGLHDNESDKITNAIVELFNKQ